MASAGPDRTVRTFDGARPVPSMGGSGGFPASLWQAGVEQFEELRGIDWDWLSMDAAMTKAPLGGEKTGPHPTDRGKSGVKHSLLTVGHGVPIGLVIEGAHRHDMNLVSPSIESIIINRPEPSEEHPQGMCLDKGYDYQEVRDILHEFGFTAHIRSRGEEAKAIKREAGGLRAPLGGGTGAFLDEPFSTSARPVGQKVGQ